MNNMSERYNANPNSQEGADKAHCARYYLARGFIESKDYVIDAACGTGYGSAILAKVAKAVLAIDKNEVFNNQWKNDKILFLPIDLENPIGVPECDVWVCLETIEHLKDPEKFIELVTQKTKKRIIISSPNKPTANINPFHKSDVVLNRLRKIMSKHTDWFEYHSFLQGEYYIIIYDRKKNENNLNR